VNNEWYISISQHTIAGGGEHDRHFPSPDGVAACRGCRSVFRISLPAHAAEPKANIVNKIQVKDAAKYRQYVDQIHLAGAE
jgi:hypothetical protein